MSRRFFLAALALCGILSATILDADEVTLEPVADNTLYQDNTGALSNGAGAQLFAGQTNDGFNRRAVLRFDLASIPAGSLVSAAELTLQMNRTQGGVSTVGLHRLSAAWGEGTSTAGGQEGGGAPATSNDATWIHRFFPAQNWTLPGGDFVATASASIPVAGSASYLWGSTPAMVADVQAWLDGATANDGWILIGDESQAQTAKRFASRSNATTASRPRLRVVYTPVVAQGACCDAAGGCSVVAAAACAGSYQGDGSLCGVGGSCGACCDGATCAYRIDATCTDYRGDASSCTPDPCPPPPTGACCASDGSCTLTTAAACAGSYQGDGSLCGAGGTCGACCDSATCAYRIDATCTDYRGDASSCTPDPCPPPPTGACCASDGSCTVTTAAACAGSYQGDGSLCGAGGTCGACCDGATCAYRIDATCTDYRGDASSCTPDPCAPAPTGACCAGAVCTDATTESACTQLGGIFQGEGQSCATDPCGSDSRACCLPGDSCVVMNRDTCRAMGGDDQDGGSTCNPNICGRGACCIGGGCVEGERGRDCVGLGGEYHGPGSSCTPSLCQVQACDLARIDRIALLQGVKSGLDVRLRWLVDLDANGYNTWYVASKADIPNAKSTGPATAVPGCEASAVPRCDHLGGVAPATGTRLYYNVLGTCNGNEAPE